MHLWDRMDYYESIPDVVILTTDSNGQVGSSVTASALRKMLCERKIFGGDLCSCSVPQICKLSAGRPMSCKLRLCHLDILVRGFFSQRASDCNRQCGTLPRSQPGLGPAQSALSTCSARSSPKARVVLTKFQKRSAKVRILHQSAMFSGKHQSECVRNVRHVGKRTWKKCRRNDRLMADRLADPVIFIVAKVAARSCSLLGCLRILPLQLLTLQRS